MEDLRVKRGMTPKLCPVAIGLAAAGRHRPNTRPSFIRRSDGELGLLEAFLQAWSACELDEAEGKILPIDRVIEKLPTISNCVPAGKASLQSGMLLRELFRLDAPANAVRRSFLQRLNAEGGEVHFLYFWRAFSEVARLVSILPAGTDEDEEVSCEVCRDATEAESLVTELEAVRDRALGLLRVRVTKKEWARDMNGSASPSRQTVAMSALASAVRSMAANSSTPSFWQAAISPLSEYEGFTEINLEQLTNLMLAWFDIVVAGKWDVGQENARPSKSQPRRPQDDCPVELESTSAPVEALPAVPKPVLLDRGAEGKPVYLNIYDAFQDGSIRWLNSLLAPSFSKWRLGGAFHAGVEVDGFEWSYGFSDPGETGVAWNPPRRHTQHFFRQAVPLGNTLLSADLVTDVLTDLCEEYRGDDYHMLRRNCCHFADDFAQRLAVNRVPAWVHRLARVFANAEGLVLGVTRGLTSCTCTNVEFSESRNKDKEDRAQWLYRL